MLNVARTVALAALLSATACGSSETASAPKDTTTSARPLPTEGRSSLRRFSSAEALDAYLHGLPEPPAPTAGTTGSRDADEEPDGGESTGSQPYIEPSEVSDLFVDRGGRTQRVGGRVFTLARRTLYSTDASTGAVLDTLSLAQIHRAHFDQLFALGDRVVLIGLSRKHRGQIITSVAVDDEGALQHESSHVVREPYRYEVERTFEGRVGSRVVFAMSQRLDPGWSRLQQPQQRIPSFCTLVEDRCPQWTALVTAEDITAPSERPAISGRKTLVSCDLTTLGRGFSCSARGLVVGGGSHLFLAHDAFYVWEREMDWVATPPWETTPSLPVNATLYRVPLDGREVSGLRVFGYPTGPFAFSRTDSHLDVVVQSGESEYRGFPSRGGPSFDVAMVHIPLSSFRSGVVRSVPQSAYVDLPEPLPVLTHRPRFYGDALLYTIGGFDLAELTAPLVVFRRATGETTRLQLEHTVQRSIEVPGGALLAGERGGSVRISFVRTNPPSVAAVVTLDSVVGNRTRWALEPVASTGEPGLVALHTITEKDGARAKTRVHLFRVGQTTLTVLGDIAIDAPSRCGVRCMRDLFTNPQFVEDDGEVHIRVGDTHVVGTIRGNLLTERSRSQLP